jgi:hypothetical protein
MVQKVGDEDQAACFRWEKDWAREYSILGVEEVTGANKARE